MQRRHDKQVHNHAATHHQTSLICAVSIAAKRTIDYRIIYSFSDDRTRKVWKQKISKLPCLNFKPTERKWQRAKAADSLSSKIDTPNMPQQEIKTNVLKMALKRFGAPIDINILMKKLKIL